MIRSLRTRTSPAYRAAATGTAPLIVSGCVCLFVSCGLFVGCALPGQENGGSRESVYSVLTNRIGGSANGKRPENSELSALQPATSDPSHAYQANSRSATNRTPMEFQQAARPQGDTRVVTTGYQQIPPTYPPLSPELQAPMESGYPPNAPAMVPYGNQPMMAPATNMPFNMPYQGGGVGYPDSGYGLPLATSQYQYSGAQPPPSSTQYQSPPAGWQQDGSRFINDVYRPEPPATDVAPQSMPDPMDGGKRQELDLPSARNQDSTFNTGIQVGMTAPTDRGHLRGGSSLQGRNLNPPPRTATDHALQLDAENRRLFESLIRTQKQLDNRNQELAETREIVSQKEAQLEQANQVAADLDQKISRLNAELKLAQQATEAVRRQAKADLRQIRSMLDTAVIQTLTGQDQQ